MKKGILFLIGLIAFFLDVKSCDLCSIYMNIEPNDLQNSMGFNYRYRLFENSTTSFYGNEVRKKHALGNTVLSEANSQKESYNSYDFWVNYFIGQKWQLNVNMTFADNYYSENDSALYNIAGPGDMSIILKHLIFNTKATDSTNLVFRLLVGGGVKLPLGNYNKSYTVVPTTSSKGNVVYGSPYTELDPHLQPGTGSLDFLGVIEFLIRYNGFGIASNISYRWNTENSNNFRFANRINTTSQFFYLLKFEKKYAVAPSFGLNYEFSNRDQSNNEDYLNSGGSALFTTFGTKVYIDKFALGFTYFDPINQHLNDNQLPNQKRMTGDLTFLLLKQLTL